MTKQEVYEMMLEKYLEDFEQVETFMERVEIGKMIIRLLERI